MKQHSSTQLSVFISDSTEITTAGLVDIVNNYPNIHEISTAKNNAEMRNLHQTLSFDLFLIDIDMLGLDVSNFIKAARIKNENAKVILLSNLDDVEQIRKLFKVGASGYLNKRVTKKEIHHALKIVLNGEIYVYSDMRKSIIFDLLEIENTHCLNSFDADILYLIAHEFSNKEIANYIGVSEKTIEYHRLNLFKSLGIKNMAGAGVYAVRHGIYFNPRLNLKFASVVHKDQKLTYA